MKKFIKGMWPFLVALIIGLTIIGIDVATQKAKDDKYPSIEEMDDYARGLVEASEIKVCDNIYHGVYTSEEINVLPDGFELYGVLGDIVPEGELIDNLTSNSISAGYEIYTSKDDNSKIYLRVTTDEDQFQSYIEYQIGEIDKSLKQSSDDYYEDPMDAPIPVMDLKEEHNH